MDWKTVVAVVSAFLCGLAMGVVMGPAQTFGGSLHNAIPFLALLTLWIVLMALKFTHRKPKC